MRVYREPYVNFVNKAVYLNILIFTNFSLYNSRNHFKKQTVLTYISTGLTYFLLVGAIIYHVVLLLKNRKATSDEQNECPTTVVQPVNLEVSHTTVEISNSQCP